MNKKCNKCNIDKTLDNFFKDKSGKYGVANLCKICKGKYNKERKIYKKEELSIKSREYYIKHKEVIKEKAITYYNENKEWLLVKKSKYKKTDIGAEKERIYEANRRGKIKSTSDNTINIKATQQLLENQGGVCNICGIDITDRKDRHLDHIEPISKGGIHSIDNVQWLCVRCNLSKSNNESM